MRIAFERLVSAAGTRSCQFAFPAVLCLKEKYGTEICLTENAAFLRSLHRTAGRIEYFPPLTAEQDFSRSLLAVEQFAIAQNVSYGFFGLTKEQADILRTVGQRPYRIEEDREWAEYVYETKSLATLEGSALKQKRKEARQCRKACGCRLTAAPLRSADSAEVLAFQQEWMRVHDAAETNTSLEGENRSIQMAMSRFDSLGLTGVVLRLDGRIVGYSYGCPVGDTYDVLVQKATTDVKYLYRVVFQECVLRCAAGYRYINAEEDLGIEGLRRLKLSYHPAFLIHKYRAVPKEDGV